MDRAESCLYFMPLLHNIDENGNYEGSYCCLCSGIAIQLTDTEQCENCNLYIENDIPIISF